MGGLNHSFHRSGIPFPVTFRSPSEKINGVDTVFLQQKNSIFAGTMHDCNLLVFWMITIGQG
jgi:hypothetical protein